jgi:hypothetical protein
MIAQGTNGLSQGIILEGMMSGENMLQFVPLAQGAIKRQPGLVEFWETMVGRALQHPINMLKVEEYKLPWSESLSLNIEEILIRPSMRACVSLSPWDHNGSVKS